MTGPWFYELPYTATGIGDNPGSQFTEVIAFPGRDIHLDAPITSRSWVWVSVSERTQEGAGVPFIGRAVISVANVATEGDGSVRVRIASDWRTDLPVLLKMLIWT
jgi:hypothetical protein